MAEWPTFSRFGRWGVLGYIAGEGRGGYRRQAAEFHRKNARAWASAAAGEDLASQIDPEFTLGPHALVLTAT
jgi:hypothetical protein